MQSPQVPLPVLRVHGTAVARRPAAVELLPKPHRVAQNVHEAQEAKVGVGMIMVFVMESAVQLSVRVVREYRLDEHEAAESALDEAGRSGKVDAL